MTKGVRFAAVMTALVAALALSAILGVSVGSTHVGFLDAAKVLAGGKAPSVTSEIVSWRLDRVVLAMVVGAALSVAGVTLQALLRNVLADPYILGVSGGGAVGAAIYITLGDTLPLAAGITGMLGFSGRAGAALVGALAASVVVLFAGRRRGHIMPATLLLVGVMVNAVCGATVLALTYLANPARSHEIVVWLMGDINPLALSRGAMLASAGFVAVLAALLWMLAGRLNVMSLGDEEALHLGVNVAGTRVESFALAAVVTGLAVALAGPIGFVGLVVPHIVRMLVGADHRYLFPASLVFGAAFLAFSDTASRVVRPGDPLPVGVLTAAMGGPFFIWLLRARRGRYFE